MKYILAVDQGTSSSRCIVSDQNARLLASAQQEFEQLFPKPGWVEHNPEQIWQSQLAVCRQVMANLHIEAADIAGIGITNQRETTLIWNRKTGKPIYNAIVWQDRRTTEQCNEMKKQGFGALIQAKTGLLLDAYFSASKIRWLLDHVPGAREQAEQGELAFGTVDTWLLWKMTAGKLHVTDLSNASRTLLYNIHDLHWDRQLLHLFDIPESILPEVKPSAYDYGHTANPAIGMNIPITAIAGDQQAALFGQMCIEPGMAKCTYGTGCFLITNTGTEPVKSNNKLLTTIAWQIDQQPVYALEGSVFTGGSVIQWLRDGLNFFADAEDSETLIAGVNDNGGVYFVPALTGLGAPYWDADARGAIYGISRGTTKAHITRAALESIAFQVNDLLNTMRDEYEHFGPELKIDGGAVANEFLVQFQADISQMKIIRPHNLETTAAGIAYMAGLSAGLWSLESLKVHWKKNKVFQPKISNSEAQLQLEHWHEAVQRSLKWCR